MNDPSRPPNPATIESFKTRKMLSFVLAVPIGLAFAVAVFQWKEIYDFRPHFGVSEDAIIWGGFAACFLLMPFALLLWRCPECGAHLGKELGVTACPSCGTPLTDDRRGR
jgi:membrane associated rhomboid family serine protease